MTSIRKIKRLKPVTRPTVSLMVSSDGIQVFGLGPVRQCANLNEARLLCEANTHGARQIRQLRRFIPTARAHLRQIKAEQRRIARCWQRWATDQDRDRLSKPEGVGYINVRPAPQQGAKP